MGDGGEGREDLTVVGVGDMVGDGLPVLALRQDGQLSEMRYIPPPFLFAVCFCQLSDSPSLGRLSHPHLFRRDLNLLAAIAAALLCVSIDSSWTEYAQEVNDDNTETSSYK